MMHGSHSSESQLLCSSLEKGRNPFCFTEEVYIELSNLCNYADVHKKCPVNRLQAEKNILPARIVYDVIDTLGRFGFCGTVGFSTYNEPLMDPRLFEFVRHTRKICPHSSISITTNGYYLTEGLAFELIAAGVSSFFVSAYSKAEEERIKAFKVPVGFAVHLMTLDDRLGLYEAPELNSNVPCYSPLWQIVVTAKGKIGLCCLDWQRQNCFSSLDEESFEEAMKNTEMWLTYERLSKGDRFLNLCKRCTWSWGRIPSQKGETSAAGESGSAGDGHQAPVNCGNNIPHFPEPFRITAGLNKTIVIDMVQDLCGFTGLNRREITRLLKWQGYNARDEFRDCVVKENCDHWFYLGSRYFLFENAVHSCEIEDFVERCLPARAKIWEFGGGTGNISLVLAAKGYEVSYTELNSLQKSFVEFRSHKYGLPIGMINFWEDKPGDTFDLVLAIDVLEHIPGYHKVLAELCESVKCGGLIWETSAFEKDPANLTHRIPDCYDYRKILADLGFELIYGVRAGRLWRKTLGLCRQRRILMENLRHKSQDDSEKPLSADAADPLRHAKSRGLEELKAGNYALALDYFEETLSNVPGYFEKEYSGTLISMGHNRLQELVLIAREALEKEPAFKHRFAESIISFTQTVQKSIEGLAKLKEGDFLMALQDFDEVITVYPRLPNLHFAKATACVQLGKLYSAKEACKVELALQPDHGGAKKLLERIDKALSEVPLMQQGRVTVGTGADTCHRTGKCAEYAE